MTQGGFPTGHNPTIVPEIQVTEACKGRYFVTAPMDPSKPTTVRFDFGDGTIHDLAISQGTGTHEMSLTHLFPQGPTTSKSYTQHAHMVENGGHARARTINDSEIVDRPDSGGPAVTRPEAMSIARADAVVNFTSDVDAHWDTQFPIIGFDSLENEWFVEFPMRVPSHGGVPTYWIDGTTGAIKRRQFTQ